MVFFIWDKASGCFIYLALLADVGSGLVIDFADAVFFKGLFGLFLTDVFVFTGTVTES
jgi:hypothetical protein